MVKTKDFVYREVGFRLCLGEVLQSLRLASKIGLGLLLRKGKSYENSGKTMGTRNMDSI